MTSAIKYPGSTTSWETGEVEVFAGSAHENYPLGSEFSSDGQSPLQSSTATSPIGSNSSSTEAALLGGLLLVLIALAAIIGNILVILSVYTNRKLRTVTNLFVVSLAFSDLMVGALVLPFAIKQQVTQTWELGSVACDVWISLDVLLCTASILNLCCISIDRYLAVTRPLVCATRRSRRRASIMIGVVWCLSALITSPPLFGLRDNARHINDSICHLTKEAGYVICSAMGSFYIPLGIMLFVYANIFVVARRAQRRWRSQSGTSLSLSSAGSRSTSLPPHAPASELPSTTGSEDKRRGGTLRVSSRSAWFCCCCLSGGQWTVTVSEVTDWPVAHDRLRLHVLRGQAAIVKYGGTDSSRTPETINGARPQMTSENPKIDTDSGEDDVIVGSNVGQRKSRSEDTDLFLRPNGRRRSPEQVSGRRHTSVESLTCAHAYLDSGSATKGGREWCGCRLHHLDSFPARDDPRPEWTRDPGSSCPKVNVTGGRNEEIIERNGFIMTETKRSADPGFPDEDKSSPLATGSSIRAKIRQDANPDSAAGRGTAAARGSVTARREEPRRSQRGKTATQDRRETSSAALREGKTAKTVSIVIGCFVLCWLPFFVVYIAEPFFPPGTFDETMTKFFVWLGYFNSVINPFIYAFYNSDFRFTFWRLTLGRVRRGVSWNRVPRRGWVPSTPINAPRFQSSLRDNAVNSTERVGVNV